MLLSSVISVVVVVDSGVGVVTVVSGGINHLLY